MRLGCSGFAYCKVGKGVYVDGHEKPDVIHHHQNVYIPFLSNLQEGMNEYEENGEVIDKGQLSGRHTILWYQDKSTFQANNETRMA